MKLPYTLTFLALMTTVRSIPQFEEKVDASVTRVSAMLADDALSAETYKIHPSIHLLRINTLRNAIMDASTFIRHTLIQKYARREHELTPEQAHLIELFNLKFEDIPLPNIFTTPHLTSLETQLSEIKWQLKHTRSHLKPGWLNVRADHSGMLKTCARIVKDYVERYNSIRFLGATPPMVSSR